MSSVAEYIADAVVTSLGNITWSPAASGNFTIVKRKVPAETKDAELPLICVTQTTPEEYERAWAGKMFVKYPVDIILVTAGPQKLGDTDPIRSWRQQIIRNFDVNTLGNVSLTKVNDVKIYPGQPFDAGALAGGHNWSVVRVTFETLEDRQ